MNEAYDWKLDNGVHDTVFKLLVTSKPIKNIESIRHAKEVRYSD